MKANTKAKSAPKPVNITVCDTPAALEALSGMPLPGLAFAKELEALRDKAADPERFVYPGVLAVALAWAEGKIAGWGELLVARPMWGEASSSLAFCRISRLDVAPAFRRRRFTDPRTGKPLSVLLLR